MCIIKQVDDYIYTDMEDSGYSRNHSTMTEAIKYTLIVSGSKNGIMIDIQSLSTESIAELYELKLSGVI